MNPPASPSAASRSGGRQKDPAESRDLGADASSQDFIDAAVESTFPASDPTAIGAGIHAAEDEGHEPPEPPRKPSSDPFPWPHGR